MLTEMFLLGLLGSAHCLGMCGGFALALRRRSTVYQAGRLLGYGLAGAAVASAGWAARLGLGNRLFMLLAGLAMMALGAGLTPRLAWGGRILVWLGPLLRRPFWLGMLTACLPCGLMGGAWMLAATEETPLRGALAMGAFWLGTLPALTLAAWLRPLAQRFPRLAALALLGIGLTMLVRGLWPEAWCG